MNQYLEKNSFDNLASFLTDIRAVIIVLLALLGFLWIETQSLFSWIFPEETMGNDWKRTAASVLIALVYECSVLLFTANSDKLGKGTAVAVAWTSFIINLFFWQAWHGGTGFEEVSPIEGGLKGVLMIFFKVFASALIAWLNYTYADLFVKLWNERGIRFEARLLVDNLEDLKKKYQDLTQQLQSMRKEVSDRKQQLEKTTCPHCREHYPTQAGFNSHVGKCSENPKNQN